MTVQEASAPRFSIIVPHHDGTVSDAFLLRGLNSLAQQTFADFEVLLYHDGPLTRPLPDLGFFGTRLRTTVSERRAGDWGHSLRDRGIREARGDYVVHFNADNVLYANALEALDEASRAPVLPAPEPALLENPDILVFAIVMCGWNYNGRRGFWRSPDQPERRTLCTGIPAAWGTIDCLQVVMRRAVWLDIGGWYDRRWDSDGRIYPKAITERGARYLPAVLGEHW